MLKPLVRATSIEGGGTIIHYKLFDSQSNREMSMLESLELMSDANSPVGIEIREALRSRLAEDANRLPGYFFECRPFASRDAHVPFEFVIVRADQLTRATNDPDTSAFREHFSRRLPFATFENVGKDATLVSVNPDLRREDDGISNNDNNNNYAHLREFVVNAPPWASRDIWIEVSRAALARSARFPDLPIWISTSGLGVYWIHVRIDSLPKYYSYAPFKRYP